MHTQLCCTAVRRRAFLFLLPVVMVFCGLSVRLCNNGRTQMVSIIPSHRGGRVSDASASVFLAPVIALLLLLSNRERDSAQVYCPAKPDTKQIKSWPLHYWSSPMCKGAKILFLGWLYFLIIYTSKKPSLALSPIFLFLSLPVFINLTHCDILSCFHSQQKHCSPERFSACPTQSTWTLNRLNPASLLVQNLCRTR